MRIRGWLVLAVGTALAASPLCARQITARTEFVAASGYLWRGITRHRFPVAQLFGSVGRTGKVDVDLSAWASGVTGSCGRPSCPEGTGLRIADVNASVMARFGLGDTRIAVGANGYRFRPAPFQATEITATTWEAVASVYAIPSRHIQFGLTAWLDLDAVDGLYAEATGTLPVTLHKSSPPRMFFTATVGFNQGQKSESGNRPVPGYFAKNGFTHLSLEAGYLVFRRSDEGRGTSLQIFVRAQGNFDPATKAPVWPFRRGGTDQQVILGLAFHPLLASGYRPATHR